MDIVHPATLPSLLYANDKGEICDLPDLSMSGRSGREHCRPQLDDLIPLPEGSELFVLDDRLPVGIDPGSGEFLKLADDPEHSGQKVRAVAAFMAPAHTVIHSTACKGFGQGQEPAPFCLCGGGLV